MKPEDLGLQVDDLEEREKRFAKQREERGWDDSDTWSLYTTLANWLSPRLKRFKELNFVHPTDITMEEWEESLDKMIVAFDLIIEDKIEYSEEEDKQIEEGLDLFRERYFGLWW